LNTAMWTIAFILAGLLLAVTTYCLAIGLLAAVSGSRFERCPTCGRHGLTDGAGPHPDGCPDDLWAHVVHLVRHASARIHRPHPGAWFSFH
jgi:hypothetical protein